MNRVNEPLTVPDDASPSSLFPTVASGRVRQGVSVLTVDDPLRAPLTGELRHRVQALLHRGERRIILDLSRVSRIDASGIGQLVRAYNVTVAANGVLRLAHATPWVRKILERVGLFDLLTGARNATSITDGTVREASSSTVS
jgi:anti-anti-sigma factor